LEHVRVYHDEASVHVNEYPQYFYLREGEQILKMKEQGWVMMVSDFVTPATLTCHLELNKEQIAAWALLPESEWVVKHAHKIIYPSSKAGCDDWWNMDQMITQVMCRLMCRGLDS
jgi:hypothetical protein